MSKYEVGDRVQIVKVYEQIWDPMIGKVGTIIIIDNDDNIKIKLDEPCHILDYGVQRTSFWCEPYCVVYEVTPCPFERKHA